MSQMRNGTLKGLGKDKRGAVLVEFAIAFMPLMITFSSFVQLQQIATARIVVKHATVVGARAAAVISNKNRNTPDADDKDNEAEVRNGVLAALGPWKGTMSNVAVRVYDTSTCADPYGMVSVEVTADYKCSVPFSNLFMCKGKKHAFKPMISRFPHQGARYQDGEGAKGCAGGSSGGGSFTGGGGSFGGGGASGSF